MKLTEELNEKTNYRDELYVQWENLSEQLTEADA